MGCLLLFAVESDVSCYHFLASSHSIRHKSRMSLFPLLPPPSLYLSLPPSPPLSLLFLNHAASSDRCTNSQSRTSWFPVRVEIRFTIILLITSICSQSLFCTLFSRSREIFSSLYCILMIWALIARNFPQGSWSNRQTGLQITDTE
ncbi:uncharacterized protein BP01DRAFT_197629 [Aspergillus saccharolyticus JOP 1030-1]|uniref:Uncharacterized protein n=1 Tax=Aspergillus saccharolyticus JOP 1030-1 TaxID=1450539 RepID=A0A319A763_9EURO|nr:hypothetical protein BP01DRAFT_197629 [Aspergillus saccharolyticus JOP 1030-1]PYH47788.1 hypothetical protein BP01DRAFT_197629 [Aspergillus saccharolyticus JOP 1030-1]